MGSGVAMLFNHSLLLRKSKAELGAPSTYKEHFSWKPVVAEAWGRFVSVCKCVLWWESHERDPPQLSGVPVFSLLFGSSPSPHLSIQPPKAKVIPVKTPFGSRPLPKGAISSEPGFYWRPKNSPEQQIKAKSQCGLLDVALFRMAVKRTFGSLTWCIECSR